MKYVDFDQLDRHATFLIDYYLFPLKDQIRALNVRVAVLEEAKQQGEQYHAILTHEMHALRAKYV